MADPSLLAILYQQLHVVPSAQLANLLAASEAMTQTRVARSHHLAQKLVRNVQPETPVSMTEFSQSVAPPVAPKSGSQLYAQRLAALQAGRLYTRLPIDSFRNVWTQASRQRTYTEWRTLLAAEARAVAAGQGDNRLAVIVGDSLSQWFPSNRLPNYQLWLNQGISGDTTRGILQRLSDFARTRPDVIYVMAGVNDLKQGYSDNEILWNLQQIVQRLQQAHPQARIVLQSILPTRAPQIPNERIANLNRKLAAIAQRNGAFFLNLHPQFAADDGRMQPEYTTDGVHLTDRGYATWQWSLQWAEMQVAQADI